MYQMIAHFLPEAAEKFAGKAPVVLEMAARGLDIM